MRHLVTLLAVAGFAVASAGFTNSANADFVVRLDNSPNPTGHPTDTQTTNTICVYADFSGTFDATPLDCRALNSVSGTHDFCWEGSETYSDVDRLKVTINGSNWFWLDQIQLFHDGDGSGCGTPSGSAIPAWYDGGDNQTGYCFSTDPNDPVPDQTPDPCYPTGASSVTSKIWDPPPLL